MASIRIGTSREEHPRLLLSVPELRQRDENESLVRWFAKYETGSDRFGEQVSRNEFQGFDSLEDAQAFCEKNALDVERTLRGDAGSA
jgi:hypothetical protein